MIDYVNKDLFDLDSTNKQYTITASNDVTLTMGDIIIESLKLSESLCSEKQITLGSCESTKAEFDVAFDSYGGSLEGETITCNIVLNNDNAHPFRLFTNLSVYSDKPNAKNNTRHIIAYDALYGLNGMDLSSWYNTQFPESTTKKTILQLRNSLFSTLGISQETTTLPNDTFEASKNVDIGSIKGKKVLHDLLEINGAMGHIGRDGVFRYVYLTKPQVGMMPSETRYPSEELYPKDRVANCVIETSKLMSGTFSAVQSEGITKVCIREDESSAGSSAGTNGNTYFITTNIFAMGADTAHQFTLAEKILNKVKNMPYTPFNVKVLGNPCYEVGDNAVIITDNGAFTTFIFQREMKGLHLLTDTLSSKGEKKISEGGASVEDQFTQVGGKLQALKITAEEIRSDMLDFEEETATNFSQTASAINAKASAQGGDTSFGWSLTANGFNLVSNSKTVFNCTSSGLTLNFSNSGSGGSLSIGDGYVFQEGTSGNVQLKNGTVITTNAGNTGIFMSTSIVLQDSSNRATRITPTSIDINGSSVATESYVNTATNDMATQSWVENKGYVDADWVIEGFVQPYQIEGMATQTWVNQQCYYKSTSELVSALYEQDVTLNDVICSNCRAGEINDKTISWQNITINGTTYTLLVGD